MIGVNGDEVFFRDLTLHLHRMCIKYWDKDTRIIRQKLVGDIDSKRHYYGASYTLGDFKTVDTFTDIYLNFWLRKERVDIERIESHMLDLMTPKMYTRAISANNDVMSGSLYNDRRIYHEVFKTPESYLEEAMDSPIQRQLLEEKFNYNFETPRKDVVYADYKGITDTIFDATVPHCLEQNI